MLYVIEDIGSRDYQEDRHSVDFNILPGFNYFAVFDGHGNEKVAVFLKLYLKDILKSELKEHHKIPIEQCLMNTFKRLQSILPRSIAMHAGSTALVILRHGNILYVANVGDSRAIINFKNIAVAITEDHKPNDPSEYERIKSVGGSVVIDSFGTPRVNGNLALSRAVGDLYLAPAVTWIPDIYRVKLTLSNKYVIAASDGLWDVFQNQEIVDFIGMNFNKPNFTLNTEPQNVLNSVCTGLIKLARSRGSGDNITIMIILL